MTYADVIRYLESYIYTMNGEYISEDNIPAAAKELADSLIKELEK